MKCILCQMNMSVSNPQPLYIDKHYQCLSCRNFFVSFKDNMINCFHYENNNKSILAYNWKPGNIGTNLYIKKRKFIISMFRTKTFKCPETIDIEYCEDLIKKLTKLQNFK